MSIICPMCKTDLGEKLTAPPAMSNRMTAIFMAVAISGKDGVTTRDLLNVLYPKRKTRGSGIVLRVQIHEINKRLEPFKTRIRNLNGHYILTKGV